MKRLILIAFVLLSSVGSYSQTLVKMENDSTFLTEYRDDDEWALIAKDSLIVGMNCKTVKDNYGIFYQLSFIIQNLTQHSFDFDPSLINVSLLNKRDETEEMRLYTAQGMQKKNSKSTNVDRHFIWSLSGIKKIGEFQQNFTKII